MSNLPIRTLSAEEALLLIRLTEVARPQSISDLREICKPIVIDEALDFVKESKLIESPVNRRTGRQVAGEYVPTGIVEELLADQLPDIIDSVATRIDMTRVKPQKLLLQTMKQQLDQFVKSTKLSTAGSGQPGLRRNGPARSDDDVETEPLQPVRPAKPARPAAPAKPSPRTPPVRNPPRKQ